MLTGGCVKKLDQKTNGAKSQTMEQFKLVVQSGRYIPSFRKQHDAPARKRNCACIKMGSIPSSVGGCNRQTIKLTQPHTYILCTFNKLTNLFFLLAHQTGSRHKRTRSLEDCGWSTIADHLLLPSTTPQRRCFPLCTSRNETRGFQEQCTPRQMHRPTCNTFSSISIPFEPVVAFSRTSMA